VGVHPLRYSAPDTRHVTRDLGFTRDLVQFGTSLGGGGRHAKMKFHT